ncbi:thiamine pyrophosphate-binding protein [Rhodoplanes sp. Z2-YC6860]|uniref:thiamine pyrophosphate-binding protein n=1 Tax=Rhodoplanes sp. Z2-YC6860 TaxID=674703 RepID=UPI00078E231E|nr:thiamine pyrophosphate-dependent enzyme [Rhodoplanes sp. Z2-YC6860]AMN42003.1 thiamine pyrophosphate binding domain-containing protein [Rhodoplanes sp. Z2-YC6860]
MSKSDNPRGMGRRNFLKGAALAGTAAVAVAPTAEAAVPVAKLKAPGPGPRQIAVETTAPVKDPATQSSSGGDFMVDVFKTLDIEYLAMNCASSFRGLHEAVLNHNNNKPEILTCPHEEIAVAMGHGYAKIEGKPMAFICHGVVGLQHATMAMYNAWCDRAPVYCMGGNIVEADKRMPGAEWVHSAIDIGALTRDFTKWDDQPTSLQHFAESAVRAYRVAMTPPMAPVLLSLDAELQENPIKDAETLHIPKLGKMMAPVGDSGSLAEAAKLLVAAENPVIICDRLARTPAGMERLVELAETLQCAVIDNAGRMNFPSRHPLNMSFRRGPVLAQADVILAIEMNDLWGVLNQFSDRIERSYRRVAKKDAKLVTLGTRDMLIRANYQDFSRYQDVDLAITGDGEASLPALTEQVKKLVDDGRKNAFEARGKKLAAARLAMMDQARSEATIGWDASPITTARMCAEVYAQIKDEDWSLVGNAIRNVWPHRLWDMKKSYQWNGGAGGAGIGYNLPASIGAALANKKHGRLTVAFGGDGDFNFVPGALWTAAHHQIPILYIVHNNRAYHQELMYLQAMAARHARGITNTRIGTTLTDPNIDYATVAKGYGIYGEGPITDPKDLAPAIKRALAVVKSGAPALIDVVTDPR